MQSQLRDAIDALWSTVVQDTVKDARHFSGAKAVDCVSQAVLRIRLPADANHIVQISPSYPPDTLG